MAPVAAPRGLADLGGVGGAEVEHLPQSLGPQMGLITQDNRPVRESGLPAPPLHRALNRAEHAALRGGIDNPVHLHKAEAVELRLNSLVAGSADHGNLPRP